MIKEISKKISTCNEVKSFFNKIKNGMDGNLAIASTARPLMTACFFTEFNKSILVIVAGEKNAKAFANELRAYCGPHYVYELIDSSSKGRIFESLFCLHSAKKGIVVASSLSIIRKYKDTDICNINPLTLQIGKEYSYQSIMDTLKSFSYTRLEALDGPGTFSVKGGTIDIFPAQLNYPVRIDFFGDEIEDIRKIVQSTGQTIKQIKKIQIFNSKENENFEKTLSLNQIINKNVMIVVDEPRAIFDDAKKSFDELSTVKKISKSDKKLYYIPPNQINFNKNQNVQFVSIMQRGLTPDAKLTLKRPPKFKSFGELSLELPNYQIVKDFNVNLSYVIPSAKLAIICAAKAQYYSRQNGEYFDQARFEYIDITKITFPYNPGDYVVHSFYGIAYFRDIVKREIAGTIRDYLLLEYAGNDKLYVPIEQFERITKYVGPKDTKPNITKLGTADWSKALSKARKSTQKMAFDLVDIYSRRVLAKGHSFKGNEKKFKAMENDFPYIETDDQMHAIEDVIKDMESIKPMDRLICGDVGFGKTEVAIRAAYKCVLEKFQVMVLCPTTILATQHFNTFNNRLNAYGVQIDVLSRFKTPKEVKKIVNDFNSGNLDILIGTHRLLSKDINPKNLGLIVIDEEQRFGVAHKEQLKYFKDSVDVLTLSATPIPRTMQMATSGVRDVSLINTPPSHRKSVEVFVGEWDLDIVSDAIRRELERKGQVYYVSNRVRTIKDAADKVGMSAGEARIGIVHGKMKKSQLESIMDDFTSGKIDVLVATTIIENGIDNPNTNTLIIEDSQNLGLSQMYQLKGRVGRGVNQAYAYFMFKNSELLSKDTVARLTAINEFTELGSGTQIAMKDLEIRGAGNFLGAEQSGNVSHVGFDLFAQMLKSAIEDAQSYEKSSNTYNSDEYLSPSISSIVVNVPGSSYISNELIPEIEKRVLWYRRFSSAKNCDEVLMLEKNLRKEYKEIDSTTQNFLLKCNIAALCLKLGIKLVSIVNGNLILEGKRLNAYKEKELRQIEGKYYDRKRKITIPLDRIIDKSTEDIFGQIFDFLLSWEF